MKENFVTLNLEKFLELNNENLTLKNEIKEIEHQYKDLIKYLLSEMELVSYSTGKKELRYKTYNNNLADYIKSIEPLLYVDKLQELQEREEEI